MGYYIGLHWDNGKENGNYYNGLYRGLYWENGKENGNYNRDYIFHPGDEDFRHQPMAVRP